VILLVEVGPGTRTVTGDHRCVKTEDQAVAAGRSIGPARWQDMFEALMGRIAGLFARVESRRRARQFVLGLMSDLPRKNCWTLAEHAGCASPDGLQHLLSRAKWDADAVRDDLRGFVVEHLRDDDAVLVVDETGDLKKGTHTVGVQRQYTGTAGRIENSQVAVYLAYSTPLGHAAIDRELYVPRSWTQDLARCQAAGIPGTVGFATKPQLAARMIGRALDAGVAASWVAGDEVYGGNPHLRTALERWQLGYVLAVACDHQITTHAGTFRADALVKKLPKRAWQKLSAGAGAKGHRFYDWALAGIADDRPGHHNLLVRRTGGTVNSPSTAATQRTEYRCPPWCGWPAADGRSRRPSSPARAWPDWTSTKSDAGRPGTVGSPSRCSPTPSSSRPLPPNALRTQLRTA
jgi:SRSO17 transposase